MRYTEVELPQQINGPQDLIKFLTFLIIFAPFRFVSTVAKKIILLGEHLRSLLLTQVVMITLLIVCSTLWNMLVTKNIQFFSGMLALVPLVVALILAIGLFYLLQSLQIPLDLDGADQHLADIKSSIEEHEQMDEEFIDEDGTVIDDPESFDGEKFPREFKSSYKSPDVDFHGFDTLSESIAAGANVFDDDVELHRAINATPKERRDPVYGLDPQISMKNKLDLLKQNCCGADLMQEEDLLRELKNPSVSDEEKITTYGLGMRRVNDDVPAHFPEVDVSNTLVDHGYSYDDDDLYDDDYE